MQAVDRTEVRAEIRPAGGSTMRPIIGYVLAGGLALGLVPAARGQSSPGEYGLFPQAGNTPQAASGTGLSASYGMLPGGFPVTSSYIQPGAPTQPSYYGANYVLPQTNSSGPVYFTPGTTSGQPTSYYGANYTLSLPGGQYPGTFTYGPTSGQPISNYGANYYLSLPGGQFTYTRGPSAAGVNGYTRASASTLVPGTMTGRVIPGASRAPSSGAP